MTSPIGYTEVDVPPHLIELFNQVFDKEFGHCRLYLRTTEKEASDADLWSVMVDGINRGILDDDEDLLDDDYVPPKKITWH